MVGTGAYASVPEACRAILSTDKTCQPNAEAVPVYEQYYQLYRKIYPALKDCYTDLAAL